MEKLGYYSSLLDMSYDEIVAHLLDTYGVAEDDYFKEKSYERFFNGEINNIGRGKTSRTSDGLYCHHIYENKYEKMADADYIRFQKVPFEYQKKEHLVYCDLIEHAILHAIIANETDGSRGINGLRAFMAPNIEDWYINGIYPKLNWEINCYNKSFLNPVDAREIVDQVRQKANM
ncbi:MAG: hypothetical protein GX760_05575 [Erysipelothrix sp.]|nr:hypothetical protein [Erysipelothrix sp.]